MKSRLRRIGNTSPEPEDRIRKLYRLRRIGDIRPKPEDRIRKLYRLRRIGDIRPKPEDRIRKLHHLRSIGAVRERNVQRQLQLGICGRSPIGTCRKVRHMLVMQRQGQKTEEMRAKNSDRILSCRVREPEMVRYTEMTRTRPCFSEPAA